MQASMVLPVISPNFKFHGSSEDCSEISKEMSEEFGAKLGLGDSESDSVGESKDFEEKVEEEEEEEEEEEFSFAFASSDGSPISAEDAFQDGQIRPMFPIFDRSLLFAGGEEPSADSSSLRPPLKKLFVRDDSSEELAAAEPGTYCEWSGKAASEASPEMSKKSNSTGFCRLWRFRDLVVRSSSDGKDAFVFLNPNSVKKLSPENKSPSSSGGAAKTTTTTTKKKGGETASSAHERHYVRNRAKKEVDKRRSYLPYRPDLVGFFTSVNGLSRNVHPF